MSNYVLDKAYRISATNGIPAGHAVVRGSSPETCDLPSGPNAGGVLGITTHAQTRQGRYVAVRRAGIATAVAATAIPLGAYVCVGDDEGRLAPVPSPNFHFGSLGANNAITISWRDPRSFPIALAVEMVDPDDEATFAWQFLGGHLRLTLTHDGQAITETALSLKAAIDADIELSRLLTVSIDTGSSGAGTMGAATARAQGIAATLNPVGVADQPATQAGDLFDVFLAV